MGLFAQEHATSISFPEQPTHRVDVDGALRREQEMRVGNDDGTGRCMRRNAVDVGMPIQMSALTVRQHVARFIGQAQMGTIAAKVNTYTIFNELSLHITGRSFKKPSIALRN